MKSETLLGIVIGAGAFLVAPVALPVVRAVGRPLIKTLVTQGLLAYERARVAMAERAEQLEDLVAEARADAEESLAKKPAASAPGNGAGAGPVGARSGRPS